jgi:hypothetical protein
MIFWLVLVIQLQISVRVIISWKYFGLGFGNWRGGGGLAKFIFS